MLYASYRIGRAIVQEHNEMQYIVSSQDPFEASLVGLCIARSRNVVHHVQIHGSFFGSRKWRKESALNHARYWFGRFVLFRTKHVRVVSERIKESLISIGISRERITVLPIYIDIGKYLDIDRNYNMESSEKSTITILIAGRLAPEKNIGLVIGAIATLAPKHSHIRLRIVGSGPEEKRLQNMVDEKRIKDIVTFVPWVESLVSELQQANIYVLSSNHEGYALVLVEAMAAGLPIVTTDVGCAGELVVNQRHGHVVPVDNARTFADKLEDLVLHPDKRKEFGEHGRDVARTLSMISEEDYMRSWSRTFLRCL